MTSLVDNRTGVARLAVGLARRRRHCQVGWMPSETATPSESDLILAVSDSAMATVLAIRAEEPDPTDVALRVEVTGSKGSEYVYDLCFSEMRSRVDGDVTYRVGELTVLIPEASVEKLRGAELDMPQSPSQSGLVIRNPNRADPLAGISIELTGDTSERVAQLLEHSINPALGAHGGYATLLGIDDDNNVYITMGGGCQGCSASALTLAQGIRKSIKEHVSEVAEVIDATDHTAGENPFYR